MADHEDHDPLDEQLHRLADLGEQGAGEAWDPADVRRRGTARRRRRTTAVTAVALAMALIVGAALFSVTMRTGLQRPDPAQSPTPGPTVSATPVRTLSSANLLQTTDIATYGSDQRVLITPSGQGRSVEQSSVCLPSGLAPLRAEQVLTRNFRISFPDEPTSTAAPGDELAQQPSLYTQALQFRDAATARAAYETYDGWLSDCRATLEDKGDTPLRDSVPTYPVRTGVSGTTGSFREVVYFTPGQQDAGWFEAVGLTLAGDRMMVTVSLLVAPDKDVSYDQDPPEGDPPAHEQYGLVTAATKRLTA